MNIIDTATVSALLVVLAVAVCAAVVTLGFVSGCTPPAGRPVPSAAPSPCSTSASRTEPTPTFSGGRT